MDLGLEVGILDLDELISKLGKREGRGTLHDWMAYYKRSPFGYHRHNLHAILAVSPYLKSGASLESLIFQDDTPELDALYEQLKAHRKAQADGD